MNPAAIPLSVWDAGSLLIGSVEGVSEGLGEAEAVADGVAAASDGAAAAGVSTGAVSVAGASAGTPAMTGFSAGATPFIGGFGVAWFRAGAGAGANTGAGTLTGDHKAQGLPAPGRRGRLLPRCRRSEPRRRELWNLPHR